jgi:hypothetical protein
MLLYEKYILRSARGCNCSSCRAKPADESTPGVEGRLETKTTPETGAKKEKSNQAAGPSAGLTVSQVATHPIRPEETPGEHKCQLRKSVFKIMQNGRRVHWVMHKIQHSLLSDQRNCKVAQTEFLSYTSCEHYVVKGIVCRKLRWVKSGVNR